MNLTDEEKLLLNQFSKSKADQKIELWLVEVIPAIVCLSAWLYTENTIYLLAAVFGYVAFNLKSRFNQNRRIKIFRSISNKILSNEKEI